MSRPLRPFSAPDLSALAKALGKALQAHQAEHGEPPGHQALMNMLVRATGARNLQAWLASAPNAEPGSGPDTDTGIRIEALDAPPKDAITVAASDDPWHDATDADALPPPPEAPPPAPLSEHARRALMQFDAEGRLIRWPQKLSVQRLALWALWVHFDARRVYTEAEVNQVLKAWHHFSDHATLRRELVNLRLLTRTPDCREYRKQLPRPDDEAQALLQAMRAASRQGRGRGTPGPAFRR